MEQAPLTWSSGLTWGPSMRVDQSIGDVLGVPFIIVLMRLFSTDERKRATTVDAELEMAEAPSGLWWESDPQLRDRMGRR